MEADRSQNDWKGNIGRDLPPNVAAHQHDMYVYVPGSQHEASSRWPNLELREVLALRQDSASVSQTEARPRGMFEVFNEGGSCVVPDPQAL